MFTFWREGCGCEDFGGDAGEVAPAGVVSWCEGERDERGAGGDEGVVELPGEVVAETGGAKFGDGEAAGGDDQRGAGDGAGGGFDVEAESFMMNGQDAGSEAGEDAGGGALAFEESDDLLGGAVAEKLAEGFFVEGDVVRAHEGDHVRGGKAGERGSGEVGVGAEEVFGSGVQVGEVAAAAAGDEDLAAGSVGVVEQDDAAGAARGREGAHEAGGTGAEDEDVAGGGGAGHRFIVWRGGWTRERRGAS